MKGGGAAATGHGLVAREQGRMRNTLRPPLLKHDWRRWPQEELLVARVPRGRTIRDMVPLRCRGFGHTRTSAPPCAAFTLHTMCSLTPPFARGHAQRPHAGLPLKLRELSSQNSAGAILVKNSYFETGLSALSKQVSLLSSFFLGKRKKDECCEACEIRCIKTVLVALEFFSWKKKK